MHFQCVFLLILNYHLRVATVNIYKHVITITAFFFQKTFIHEFQMFDLDLFYCILKTLAFTLLYILYCTSVTVFMHICNVQFSPWFCDSLYMIL